MKSKTKKIIILIVLLLFFIGDFVLYQYLHRFIYNNDTAVGNTTGNLMNGGRFCEVDGKIYFSNPADDDALYRMNSDCSSIKKLSSDKATAINVYGKYVYYVKNNFSRTAIEMGTRTNMYGVMRINTDGTSLTDLDDTKSKSAVLSGNYVFYENYNDTDGLKLYKVKIDGKSNVQVLDYSIDTSSIFKNKIFYINKEAKNNIYSMDTKTGNISLEYEANAFKPDCSADYLYYIDLSKNYALMRVNRSNKTLEQVYASDTDKVINYNRSENKIYFVLEGDNSGLYRMNLNGSSVEKVTGGNISEVYCTSQYTFFIDFKGNTLMRIPTDGPITKIQNFYVKN